MTTVTTRPETISEQIGATPPVSAPRRRHLLDLDDWTPDEMRAILTRAGEMRALLNNPSATRLESLRGVVLVNSEGAEHIVRELRVDSGTALGTVTPPPATAPTAERPG